MTLQRPQTAAGDSRIGFANVGVPGGCAPELMSTEEYIATGIYSQIGQFSPWLAIGVSDCPPTTTPQGGVRLISGYCLQELSLADEATRTRAYGD